MNYAQCGEDQKLKKKIWHSDHYRHIALLKKTHKQVKIHYSIIYIIRYMKRITQF